MNRLLLRDTLPGAAGLFFAGYFNDILAGCAMLAITNALLALGRLPPLGALPRALGLCLACGLFWELVTPLYLPRSTGDPLDIAAYLAGGAIWYLLCRLTRA